MRFYVTNIDWDTNTDEGHEQSLHLPEDVIVQSDCLNLQSYQDDEVVASAIGDYLGIRYGFQVNGFVYIDEDEVQGGEKV